MTDSGKITSSHLSRAAVIYVRQSTLAQLERNTESTARQYDLVNRARQLGWPPEAIRVIDGDLVPLEYSIEWLTCAIGSRSGSVMVGWPSAAQDRLLAGSPGTRPGYPNAPRGRGEGS